MGNFQDRDNRGGGGFRGGRPGGFQKKSWGNDRGGDRGEVTMHKATCNECGKSCEVPFRPSGDKPVYCNDCFAGKRDSTNDRGPRKDFGNRGPSRDFRNDRPAPRGDFSRPSGSSDDTKKVLAEINTKLDRLVNAIEKLTGAKKTIEEPVEKAKKEERPSISDVVKKAVKSSKKTEKKTKVEKKVAVKKVIKKKKK